MEDIGHRYDVMEVPKRVCEEVEKDPEVAKEAEGCQRKYGTLTAEDLAMTFTI